MHRMLFEIMVRRTLCAAHCLFQCNVAVDIEHIFPYNRKQIIG